MHTNQPFAQIFPHFLLVSLFLGSALFYNLIYNINFPEIPNSCNKFTPVVAVLENDKVISSKIAHNIHFVMA